MARGRTATREKDEVTDFLMGGGIPSASFKHPARYEGEILDMQMRQRRSLDTGELMTWKDGSPQMQLVITLQTDEDDPEIEDDDGKRNVYAYDRMRDAIRDAVKAAKAPKLEIGGWLAVEWEGKEDKPKVKGHNGRKWYVAEYEPPDPADFIDEDDPDEDEEEDEPPARSRNGRKAAAKKAPAKSTSRRRAEPEPDEDDDEEEDEPPARSSRTRKAAAKKSTSRRRRAEPEEDDDEPEDDEDEPPARGRRSSSRRRRSSEYVDEEPGF